MFRGVLHQKLTILTREEIVSDGSGRRKFPRRSGFRSYRGRNSEVDDICMKKESSPRSSNLVLEIIIIVVVVGATSVGKFKAPLIEFTAVRSSINAQT